jgi:DNA-binding response OmpR family regulator
MAKKILIADDEKFINRAYSDTLQRAGYEVIVALNGEEALEKITKEKPDLILLDLIMPKMNGFEVLKKVKSHLKLKDIPVLVLSNLSQETDEAELKRLGAVDFLVKSDISLEELLTRIKQFFE